MKILKGILFFVLGLIAIVLIGGLLAPKEFGGKSEIIINQPKKPFTIISSF